MSSTDLHARRVPAGWTLPDLLALLAVAAPCAAAAWAPAVAQWQSYHDFADQRAWLGIASAFNVASNAAFLIVGALGVAWLARTRPARAVALPYGVFFAGVLLTSIGSAWYHLAPRDASLVWDRLPMALAFAGLVAGTLADRIAPRAAAYTAVLASTAVGSVLYWFLQGNVLPYLVMQASFVAAALLATALIRSPYTQARWLYAAAALYAGAIVCEKLDKPIAALLDHAVSGHTLKHLLAAAGLYVVFAMLRSRRAVKQR